ncbi:hypothetical protein NDU88_008891 [Pleurodeles waltl]|uniref:Uncharacterized protein n=1 Tax=Pleurodeles waltl TaxID=8319 RepID=A0AAV7PUA1_PLEWA|nr:hypothetical protein NDU88_008891 [Pleurodeles waltl]
MRPEAGAHPQCRPRGRIRRDTASGTATDPHLGARSRGRTAAPHCERVGRRHGRGSSSLRKETRTSQAVPQAGAVASPAPPVCNVSRSPLPPQYTLQLFLPPPGSVGERAHLQQRSFLPSMGVVHCSVTRLVYLGSITGITLAKRIARNLRPDQV